MILSFVQIFAKCQNKITGLDNNSIYDSISLQIDDADNNKQTTKSTSTQAIAEPYEATSSVHCYANELSVWYHAVLFLFRSTAHLFHIFFNLKFSRNPVLSYACGAVNLGDIVRIHWPSILCE